MVLAGLKEIIGLDPLVVAYGRSPHVVKCFCGFLKKLLHNMQNRVRDVKKKTLDYLWIKGEEFRRIKVGTKEETPVIKVLSLNGFLQKHDTFYLYLRTVRCAFMEGPTEARRRYKEYINANRTVKYTDHFLTRKVLRKQRKEKFSTEILFSVIVPLYNTPKSFLREMIRSLKSQTYGKWELCMADGSDMEHAYVGRICKRKARRDNRIKYRKLEKNEGISENSNVALEMATGSYIALLDHDDLLHPSALYEVMRIIEEKKADLIYSDEAIFRNKMNDGNRFHFKPDFSPDMLRGYNYVCHFLVFSKELLEKAGNSFRVEYDGSQDYDLVLRLTEKAKRIIHIPKVLYFWRNHAGSVASNVSVKPYAINAAKKALAAHLKRIGLEGKVEDSAFPSTYRIHYYIKGRPRISIIIPNKDHATDLQKCLDSIREKTTWSNWEVIIVENNSCDNTIFQYYQQITKEDHRIRMVRWEGLFNFSAICNYGVSFATGDYYLLLNNDTEVITPNWIEEMLMFAQRKDVGAVGAMLYYPDETVQHAGVIVGIGLAAGHSHRGYQRGDNGYYFRLSVATNLSAVTGACMMIPKDIYEELGGLDESFRIALNDVDLCMRIRQLGYLIVFTPYAELYHYESKSRGSDENGENRERFEAEAAFFREKWAKEIEHGDPYYNPNLTHVKEDFSIRDSVEKEQNGTKYKGEEKRIRKA